MKKYLSGFAFSALIISANCFAASVCTVSQASGVVYVYCDGSSVSLSTTASGASDPFTAELDSLLAQGYTIASSAGTDTGIETILVK